MEDTFIDRLLISYKWLSLISILLIVIFNCLLIFKTVKKGGFLYKPKSLTLISLAIGDIFLALFPLVVQARIYFEWIEFIPSCSTTLAANVYLTFLIHFVNGIGLVVLAVELVRRYQTRLPIGNTTNNLVKAVVYSAVPWIFGLIIVLPVTMVDVGYGGICNLVTAKRSVSVSNDWLPSSEDITTSTKRIQAMFGVSVLAPAILAVVACTATKFIKLEPIFFPSQAVSYQSTTPEVVVATNNTTNAPQQYLASGASGTEQVSTVLPAIDYNDNHNQSPKLKDHEIPSNSSHSQLQQYHTQQYPTSQYPTQQYQSPHYPPQQYLMPQFPVQHQSAQSNVIIATPMYSAQPQTAPLDLQDPYQERNLLLKVAFIYFVCVVPRAAFIFGLIETASDGKYGLGIFDLIAVDAALLWLSVFRSVFTPIVWLASSRN